MPDLPVTEDFVETLRHALTNRSDENPEDLLHDQTIILDKVFRRLLSDSDYQSKNHFKGETITRYRPESYDLAFRAQNLCRMTAKTRHNLKTDKQTIEDQKCQQ